MGLSVCPVAVVAAPVEWVWRNLVEWERYAEWADVRVARSEPGGPAIAGQTIIFTGMGLHFTFQVEAVDPERHRLDLHVVFPFGLQEKPTITCTALDATTCRVEYG